MDAAQHPSASCLTLAAAPGDPAVGADWVGKLFMLGRRLARWANGTRSSQLVVALSVPVRDFAAVLVGCGWMSAAPAPSLPPVREVLAGLPNGAGVRVVSQTRVFTERFGGIDDRGLAHLGTKWQVDKLQAVTHLAAPDEHRKQPIPEPGVISQLTGLAADWAARLCAPPQDLALVGTAARLSEDLGAQLGRGSESEPVSNILLPAGPRAVTWSTRICMSAHLDDVDLPVGLRAVVLDGATPTRYLAGIETPVVVAVLDRSVADTTVPELVMNYRNTRGEHLSLQRDLQWTPPTGVEALAFEVPL